MTTEERAIALFEARTEGNGEWDKLLPDEKTGWMAAARLVEKWTERNCDALAVYIYEWFETRNDGEFEDAIGEQAWAERKLAVSELAHILFHNGRPPNWVKR